MAHEVNWTRRVVDCFIKEAMLTPDEVTILLSRVEGMTIVEQSLKFNMGISKVNRITESLKRKYDEVQKYNSDILPLRIKKSVKK